MGQTGPVGPEQTDRTDPPFISQKPSHLNSIFSSPALAADAPSQASTPPTTDVGEGDQRDTYSSTPSRDSDLGSKPHTGEQQKKEMGLPVRRKMPMTEKTVTGWCSASRLQPRWSCSLVVFRLLLLSRASIAALFSALLLVLGYSAPCCSVLFCFSSVPGCSVLWVGLLASAACSVLLWVLIFLFFYFFFVARCPAFLFLFFFYSVVFPRPLPLTLPFVSVLYMWRGMASLSSLSVGGGQH